MPGGFLLGNYNYSYTDIYMHRAYVLYKVEIIFPHSLLHYRHTFSSLHESLYAGRAKFFAEASERFTRARCIAGRRRRRPQYGVLGMHTSGGPKLWKPESAKLGLQGG
jgi:hypothetical protein